MPKSCRKINYESRKQAIVATKNAKKEQRPYVCPRCGNWHTTSMTKRQHKSVVKNGQFKAQV